MKDTIYTIPLTEAFSAEDECPFCFVYRKLEQEAIAFTLGSSYMEDDHRALTDDAGFCSHHFKMLYDYGNRLGLALTLQTHYQSLLKALQTPLKTTTLPKVPFMTKLKKGRGPANTDTPATELLHKRLSSCAVCNRIDANFDRYMKTFFYLISSDKDFREIFMNSKGFCLPHFTALLEAAPLYLKESEQAFFVETSTRLVLDSLERIQGDIDWFIEKYDYRNSNEPWKNAKDALPRGIQKISACYVQDKPFVSADRS